MENTSQSMAKDVIHFLVEPNALRSVLIFLTALVVAYWLSRFIAHAIIRFAQQVAVRSDRESNDLRVLRLRQIETYLSIATAVVRALVVAIVGYIAWKMLSPFSATNMSSSAAAIGAGAFFVFVCWFK